MPAGIRAVDQGLAIAVSGLGIAVAEDGLIAGQLLIVAQRARSDVDDRIEPECGAKNFPGELHPQVVARDVACVVLGCTHFPLFRTTIEAEAAALAGRPVAVVDSATATAEDVASFLAERGHATARDRRGTLELLVLKALAHGPRHGYGIVEHLRAASGDALEIGESALYPALQRLLLNGWVTASWGASENNRRARFYTLTARGRRQLDRERATFERRIAIVRRVLEA